jgi:hypothetical protein
MPLTAIEPVSKITISSEFSTVLILCAITMIVIDLDS